MRGEVKMAAYPTLGRPGKGSHGFRDRVRKSEESFDGQSSRSLSDVRIKGVGGM